MIRRPIVHVLGAALAGAVLMAGAPLAPANAAAIKGAAYVVDGGTITVGAKKIRLFGIEAPHRKQICSTARGGSYPCGLRAAFALDHLVRGKAVTCEPRGIGADRLVLATCSLSGLDLASAMVEAGWAIVDTSFAPQYAETEAVAKASRIGLWAGAFQNPAEWRALNGGA